MEYFGVQQNLMQVWIGCVGYSKITKVVEDCRSGCYGIVVSHSPI